MKFLVNSKKGAIVSVGVSIYMLLILTTAILGMIQAISNWDETAPFYSVWLLIASFLTGLVYYKKKVGYFLGKMITGLFAIVYVIGAFNPFMVRDGKLANVSIQLWFILSFGLGALFIFLFYSLQEHYNLTSRTKTCQGN